MNNKLIWFSAYLLSVTVTAITVQYLWERTIDPFWVLSIGLGSLLGWVLITRIGRDRIEPQVDERYEYHAFLSGYRAFLFLNLLLIAALLQPWVAHGRLALWVGVLFAGLLFWVANLLILERRR